METWEYLIPMITLVVGLFMTEHAAKKTRVKLKKQIKELEDEIARLKGEKPRARNQWTDDPEVWI